jgi:coniferyl-aldehyde dehydrogenase
MMQSKKEHDMIKNELYTLVSFILSNILNLTYDLLINQARAQILTKWADLIEQNIEELAALDTIDAGKLYSFCKAVDIPGVSQTLRYYAGAADKIHGEVLKPARELHAYTLMEPIGVVGHIIPWNFPSTMFVAKVAPSLAAGCTMVLKPAEQTPLSALFYAHLAKKVMLKKFD